jgi:membrane-bound lytic murein transglycosylase F
MTSQPPASEANVRYTTRWGRVVLPVTVGYVLICALLAYWATPKPPDLHDWRAKGYITVITRNNATCYYQYRSQPMGFEYDLAKAFAAELGLPLKVIVSPSWEGMIPALLNGEGAFIAANLTVTPRRREQVRFSNGYKTIQQHLVVHRFNRRVRGIGDLDGRTVDVRRGTSYHEQLEQLQARGIGVQLRLHDDLPTEELIRQVADRTIDITVADSHIARLNRRYYPQIRIAGAISDEQQLAWAVHPKAVKLRRRINAFFNRIQGNGTYRQIENRYFADTDHFDYVDLRAYHRRLKSRLPRYLPQIKAAAAAYGFDWRLIAAQIYQESHFDPKAVSFAGAVGLMQITPVTAGGFGIDDIHNPVDNIWTGVAHLRKLYDFFDQARGKDRMFIAMAAYNVGQGHIFDARNLARDLDLNPEKWASLTQTLPMLRYEKYFGSSLYGYCRGDEPVRYIQRINIYYDILKRQSIEYRDIRERRRRTRGL